MTRILSSGFTRSLSIHQSTEYKTPGTSSASRQTPSAASGHGNNGIRKPDIVVGGLGHDGFAIVTEVGENKTDKEEDLGSDKRTTEKCLHGLAQAITQILSASSAFGTYLAHAMINTRFLRIVCVKEDQLALETEPRFQQRFVDSSSIDRIISVKDLFERATSTASRGSMDEIFCHRLSTLKEDEDPVLDLREVRRWWTMHQLAGKLLLKHDRFDCVKLERPKAWEARLERFLNVRMGDTAEDTEALTSAQKPTVKAFIAKRKEEGESVVMGDDGDDGDDEDGAGGGSRLLRKRMKTTDRGVDYGPRGEGEVGTRGGARRDESEDEGDGFGGGWPPPPPPVERGSAVGRRRNHAGKGGGGQRGGAGGAGRSGGARGHTAQRSVYPPSEPVDTSAQSSESPWDQACVPISAHQSSSAPNGESSTSHP